jgi:hypothetical protein
MDVNPKPDVRHPTPRPQASQREGQVAVATEFANIPPPERRLHTKKPGPLKEGSICSFRFSIFQIPVGALPRRSLRQARAEASEASRRVVLDLDSSESPVYGQQEGSAYNGYFDSVCYHPLFLFNSQGDCLAVKLRPGNVHSSEDWKELLLPEIEVPTIFPTVTGPNHVPEGNGFGRA